MSLPERVINVIRNHHERFDGSGYPYGSSGEEIPFMARIVAPCESYISLTSLRPYRRSLTSDQAMKKLQAEAGLFDPVVFKAFEDVIHSKLFLKENMLEPEIA
jgi:putative two-component system response regulator